MLLRDHPLISYHRSPTWPPLWVSTDPSNYVRPPRGEIGILKKVEPSDILPANRFYLRIDHEGSSYIGCLLIEDEAFCQRVVELLRGCINRPISEIGSLDVSHTL